MQTIFNYIPVNNNRDTSPDVIFIRTVNFADPDKHFLIAVKNYEPKDGDIISFPDDFSLNVPTTITINDKVYSEASICASGSEKDILVEESIILTPRP